MLNYELTTETILKAYSTVCNEDELEELKNWLGDGNVKNKIAQLRNETEKRIEQAKTKAESKKWNDILHLLDL